MSSTVKAAAGSNLAGSVDEGRCADVKANGPVDPGRTPDTPAPKAEGPAVGQGVLFRHGHAPISPQRKPRNHKATIHQHKLGVAALLKRIEETVVALREVRGEHNKDVVADKYDYWPGHVNPRGLLQVLAELPHPSPDERVKHPPACLDAITRDLPMALAFLNALDKALNNSRTATG
jgi:hypothetical protein